MTTNISNSIEARARRFNIMFSVLYNAMELDSGDYDPFLYALMEQSGDPDVAAIARHFDSLGFREPYDEDGYSIFDLAGRGNIDTIVGVIIHMDSRGESLGPMQPNFDLRYIEEGGNDPGKKIANWHG